MLSGTRYERRIGNALDRSLSRAGNYPPRPLLDRFALKIFDAIQFEYESADRSEIILAILRLFDKFIESRMGIAALTF